jgi:hypothetical protein
MSEMNEKVMYAINVREPSYACGNIYAIFTNKECAKKCIQEKFPENDDLGNDTWVLFPNDSTNYRSSY